MMRGRGHRWGPISTALSPALACRAAALVGLVGLLAVFPVATAHADAKRVTAVYSGTLTNTTHTRPSDYPFAYDDYSLRITWTETVTGPPGSTAWSITQLTGSFTGAGSVDIGNNMGQQYSCTATVSRIAPTSAQGPAGSILMSDPKHWSVTPPGGIPFWDAAANITSDVNGGCESPSSQGFTPSYILTSQYWSVLGGWSFPNGSSAAQQLVWLHASQPTVEFPLDGSNAKPINLSFTCSPPGVCPYGTRTGADVGQTSSTFTLTSSVTFGCSASASAGLALAQGGQAPAAMARASCTKPPKKHKKHKKHKKQKPPPKPGTQAERNAWKNWLKRQANKMPVYCANAKRFGDVSRALTQHPNTKWWVGPAVDHFTNAGEGSCRKHWTELKRELQVAEKDPAAANFSSIALPQPSSLPTAFVCKPLGLTTSQLAACHVVAQDWQAMEAQFDRAVLIADAIATTINRHTGAVNARNESAITLQQYTYQALLAELAHVTGRLNQASGSLATALRTYGIGFTFLPSFVRNPIGFLTHLAKHVSGQTKKNVELMLQVLRLYTPRLTTSFVGALEQPVSIGHLADSRRSLTTPVLIRLVRQLANQHQIDRAIASSVITDLTDLQNAHGDARSVALTKLAADLARVTSEAGPLLEAASGVASSRL